MIRRRRALIGAAAAVLVTAALALLVTQRPVLVGQSIEREDGETWIVCRYFNGTSVYERYGHYSREGWRALALPEIHAPRPALARCPLAEWEFVIVD